MKNKLLQIAILLSFITLASCDYEDTNVDPANPLDANIPLLLPTIEARIAYFLGGDASRYNGVFSQHFSGGGRQHLLIGRYGFTEADVNTAWNQQYAGSLQDLKVILDKANAEGAASAEQFSGAAKVLTAYLIVVLSDLYDEIPYSEALLGTESVEPVYDSREQIYASAHSLLAEGITELGVSSDLSLGSEDLIYEGDTRLWIKAAHSIEARLYLHEGNYDAALISVANGFTSNDDDMQFGFGASPTETNPWYQFEEQRGDVVMGEYFINMLEELNDPRLPFFAIPTNYDEVVTNGANAEYRGAPAGNPVGGESLVADLNEVIETTYTSRTSAVPFITYSELKFIEAEAHLRKASQDVNAAADAANQGIEASLAKVTGTSGALYLASNGLSAENIDLESIINQKYIALFTQTESWNDWRRTGYPQIQPVGDNNQIGANLMPLRWPLPQGESLFNATNHAIHVTDIEIPTVLNGFTWDGTPK